MVRKLKADKLTGTIGLAQRIWGRERVWWFEEGKFGNVEGFAWKYCGTNVDGRSRNLYFEKRGKRYKFVVMELRCLRGMCYVTFIVSMMDENFKSRAGVRKKISYRVSWKVLTRFGLVERMVKNLMTSRVYESHVMYKQDREMPCLKWLDKVKSHAKQGHRS